jgi:uncharacterized RDD family membrane protein YckC
MWRRFLAFAIDGIITGLVVSLVTLPFFDALSRLGPWGRLIGLLITLPYFAILDSRVGNGQTLGKRLLRVQVVDKEGATISIAKSVLRYALFAIPFFANGIVLPTSRTPWIVSVLLTVITFGMGGAILYLLLFNRRTKQGLHDVAAGTYVADASKTGTLHLQPIWKIHWVILGSLFLIFSVGGAILSSKLTRSGPFPQLVEDIRLIEGIEGVQAAGVQDLTWTNWGSGEKTTIFVINVYWTGKSDEDEAFADQVSKLILGRDAKVREHDQLRVTLIRGYDLGIAHTQVAHTYQHTPAEWNVRLLSR